MTQTKNVPAHIAIIMDGNGRWAKQRNKLRALGHIAGLKAVRKVVKHAKSEGVKALTLYAFSSENWNRPEREVSSLMKLFVYALNRDVKSLHKNNIQLKIIGDISRFPPSLQKMIIDAEKLTEKNNSFVLNIAANYGGRWDVIQAIKKVTNQFSSQQEMLEQLTEDVLDQAMSLYELPPIDLVIRTGGEHRISNFLLWQIAYSELYFTDILWPDFDHKALSDAINSFNQRERRFGRVIETE